MHIEIIDNPTIELINAIDKKIEEFNLAHWEETDKKPIATIVNNENNEIIAGATAKTFGYWLLIDNIWVSENLRGKNIGSQLLYELEKAAINRDCKYALLDTLNF